jgi:hypothetical protein
VFLVRELVELSVSHILASRCTITEGEIAVIVRPVRTTLKGRHAKLNGAYAR